MMARVSSMTRGTSSSLSLRFGCGSWIEVRCSFSFCWSSRNSSTTFSTLSKDIGPSTSSSSKAPTSASSPYSAAKNSSNSAALAAAADDGATPPTAGRRRSPAWLSPSSSSSKSSPSSPSGSAPMPAILAACMALKAAKSGRFVVSFTEGPQICKSSSTTPPGMRSWRAPSSSSSYSSAISRARMTSCSSVVDGCGTLNSFSGTFSLASITTPTTPPPFPVPLTRFRCWS
mmetsp:Transcript_62942/g.175991  ORF Transcript_62942/g.175991 Transcript_62942/m.175991 type:complete len:230 (-) Transcript_62942:248-937(-)